MRLALRVATQERIVVTTRPMREFSVGKQFLILALLGGTLGPVLDYFHVVNHAIQYRDPTEWGIAWWVPLEFAGAAVALGLSHPLLDRMWGRRQKIALTGDRLFLGVAGLAAIWFATGALPMRAWAIGLVLAPPALALWWFFDRTWQGVLLGVATAAMGVVFEITLVNLGVFKHVSPDMLGVSSWLPCIYFAASVALGNVGRRMDSAAVTLG